MFHWRPRFRVKGGEASAVGKAHLKPPGAIRVVIACSASPIILRPLYHSILSIYTRRTINFVAHVTYIPIELIKTANSVTSLSRAETRLAGVVFHYFAQNN